MKLSEQLAAAVLRKMLPQAQVSYRASQPHGEHDFDLLYPDGRTACLEVASAVDTQTRATVAAILAERHGADYVPAIKARSGWYITPMAGADINRIRREIDASLAQLDEAGIDSFDQGLGNLSLPSKAAFEALRVLSGDVVSFVPDGKIQIALPSDGGTVNPGAVNLTVSRVAERPDNMRKLSMGAYDERHLFVYIDDSAHAPHAALFLSDYVASPPTLPAPITHVWAGTFLRTLEEVVVWTARNGYEWERHLLQIPTIEHPRSP
jgi:hypothetical protein